MKRKKIIFLAVLTLFIVTACSSPIEQGVQEPKDQFRVIHSMDNMPCHQMPDGSWMGDCPDSVGEGAHDMHAMHTVHSEEEFVREMIPHHQEAVDTSRIIVESTTNNALRDLAQRIIVAQEEEIAMMESWIDEWYESDYQVQYVPMMRDLLSVEGAELDRIFIEDMILHHEMAVMMAEQVLAFNPREEVVIFAQEVIAVQQAEIDEMRALLEN